MRPVHRAVEHERSLARLRQERQALEEIMEELR
jgi:hypothetical protein